MNVLAIDTSLLSGAAIGAVFDDGQRAERTLAGDRCQESRLLSAVDELLSSLGKVIGGIDLFCVAAGPGSFTGLRIGIGTVKGLAFALGKPVAAVPSLEALAATAFAQDGDLETLVVPMIDARMGRVFAAVFRAGERIFPDADMEPAELVNILAGRSEKRILFAGNGLNCYLTSFSGEVFPGKIVAYKPEATISGLALADAGIAMAAKGQAVSAEELDAVYLRKSEAESRLEEKNPRRE
jgi:tRNA threonylcarbamoyladenosine biosynthesis protein TsaB